MAIPEGRGSIFVFRNWKFRGGGATCVKFPPSWRYGYFLELHIITNNKIEKKLLNRLRAVQFKGNNSRKKCNVSANCNVNVNYNRLLKLVQSHSKTANGHQRYFKGGGSSSKVFQR